MTELIPQRTTAEWRKLDSQNHLHTFTDFKELAEQGGSRIIVSADGMYLNDSEGNRIIDGMAGLWCVNLGYGRKELAEVAYQQMIELPYYNTFFKTAHPPSIELAHKLCQIAPNGMNKVLFGSSGSDAVDSAVRMVRHYWQLLGHPERRVIIGREFGYHGSTMAGASVGGMGAMHGQGGLPFPDFEHIMPPYWYRFGGEMSQSELAIFAAEQLEKKILAVGPERVAAFFAEPIQGAGGVIIPPDGYWPAVMKIVEKYGILLVADEVICGYGRTGQWFGSQTYQIKPDIMTSAKALTSGYLPLSAVFVGERVEDVLWHRGGEFYHGFTYSGHPVACAVALKCLALTEQEKLIERVREDTGPYLKQKLAEIAEHDLVAEVRLVGLVAAIELSLKKSPRGKPAPDMAEGQLGTTCRDHCFNNGLVMRAVRDGMILSPPLIATREDLDHIFEKVKICFDLTAADYH